MSLARRQGWGLVLMVGKVCYSYTCQHSRHTVTSWIKSPSWPPGITIVLASYLTSANLRMNRSQVGDDNSSLAVPRRAMDWIFRRGPFLPFSIVQSILVKKRLIIFSPLASSISLHYSSSSDLLIIHAPLLLRRVALQSHVDLLSRYQKGESQRIGIMEQGDYHRYPIYLIYLATVLTKLM